MAILLVMLLPFVFMTTTTTAWLWSKKQQTSTDPEMHMTLEDIVRHWGFPVESHDIKTGDGYFLSAFRIPFGRNDTSVPTRPRPVVLLMHGLDTSWGCFISNLPDKDMAYLYADAGVDVWLGNFRGNVYAKRHESLSPNQHAFWNFGLDEMAQYDLPATIDYILNVSRSKFLYYVGHSMGSTTAFALLSVNQTYAKKIRRFYALGPVTTGKNLKGSSRNVLAFVSATDATISKLGADPGSFLTTNPVAKRMVKLSCGPKAAQLICSNVIFLTEGPDTGQLNKTRIPVFMAHMPSGSSWRTVAHFGQMLKSGRFQKYDFGTSRKNRLRYGQDTPPLYDITKIEVPVGIYWGDKDYLAPPEDVQMIMMRLKNIVVDVFLYNYNHVDFIWGSRARDDVYLPMLKDIWADFGNATRVKTN